MPSMTTTDESQFPDPVGSGNYMGKVSEIELTKVKATGAPQVRISIDTMDGRHTEWVKTDNSYAPLPGFPHQVKAQILLRGLEIPSKEFWDKYAAGVREPLSFEWAQLKGGTFYFELRWKGEFLNITKIQKESPPGALIGPDHKEAPKKEEPMDFSGTNVISLTDDSVPF